jgi:putative inorganic carbon (HCO3(-)) transporter
MGSVLMMLALAVGAAASIAVPAIGVALAYLIAILNPQAIWWWNFEGLRPVYWVLLPTLLGVCIKGVQGKLDWTALGNVRVLCLVVLTAAGIVSWAWAPFSTTTTAEGELEFRSAAFIVENLVKIVLLALVSMLVIIERRHAEWLGWVMVASGVYLTWWINDRYLFQGAWGRLGGPRAIDGSGNYIDENVFATLFVGVMPFLWYAGWVVKRRWIRYALWLVVPFVWHAVFLTGSRGGLLALGASMVVMTVRMKRRLLGLVLMGAFVLAYAFQAGDTMWSRAATIDDYSEDESASGRIEAWIAGARMMAGNPLTGVGPGAFVRAFGAYSDAAPRQAHNTYVQFGAEFGPLALLVFTVLLISCAVRLWCSRSTSESNPAGGDDGLAHWRDATLAALVGVAVCAVFLSLQIFEPLYFLIAFACVLTHPGRQPALAASAIDAERDEQRLEPRNERCSTS